MLWAKKQTNKTVNEQTSAIGKKTTAFIICVFKQHPIISPKKDKTYPYTTKASQYLLHLFGGITIGTNKSNRLTTQMSVHFSTSVSV